MHAGGRPLQYSNPEDMQVIIDCYFLSCALNRGTDIQEGLNENGAISLDDFKRNTYDEHPTISGMALVLDLTRNSLIQYEGREEFVNTVKKGKVRVESYAEQRLQQPACTGTIFSLKNNFGWCDKREIETSGTMTVTVSNEDAGTA